MHYLIGIKLQRIFFTFTTLETYNFSLKYIEKEEKNDYIFKDNPDLLF